MNKISIKLFGIPQIYRDDEKIVFPYSKISALIFYLAVNRFTTRDEIAGLLWPFEEEQIAKKNLRNAIYQAKKCLGVDFITSPKKSVLEIDKNLDITCDAVLFNENPLQHLDLYSGSFLQGFFVKDAEAYEYWITSMRNYFEEKFISTSYDKLEKDINEEHYENVEKEINRLIKIDEMDERSFRLLMKYYQKTDRNGKVVKTYYNLARLLQDELGVSPDSETRKIYEQSIQRINLNNKKPKIRDEYFYGRYKELAEIQASLNNVDSNECKATIIYGEAGIGKSALKRKVLEQLNPEIIVLESYCYQAEENYALRSFGIIIEKIGRIMKEQKIPLPTFWNVMMKRLFPPLEDSAKEVVLLENHRTLNFDLMTQVIVEAIKKISPKNKIVIVFEDIQWIDQTSAQLLTSVILRLKGRVSFCMTSRMSKNSGVEDMVSTLLKYKMINRVYLNRFNEKETNEFLKGALTQTEIDDEVINKIYKETEGNSFFLTEYINILKNGNGELLRNQEILDSMQSRFAYLSKQERDIIDIVSYFYDEAPLPTIVEITGQNEFDIIGLIEDLENDNILMERVSKNNISVMFTHSKLREYIYMLQPESKKKIIHNRIAQILENNLEKTKNLYVYSKLVYHYSRIGENIKSLKYQLEMLNYYLNFSHELFPILNFNDVEKNEAVYITRDEINEKFARLEKEFEELKDIEKPEELEPFEISFYYMKGRYLIREGVYAEGLEDIKYVISKAKEIDSKDYVLDGYKQMIYYNIQTNRTLHMLEYIEAALDLAVVCNYYKEIGILLRLKGLYNIMIGESEAAEKLLNDSINSFTVTKEVANRYAINIAAALNYIGEIRWQESNYEAAIDQYKKAIDLSEGKNALASLSVFHINKGKAHFANGQMEEAEKEFKKAYELYGQFDSFWKRPVLDAYMTLCEFEKGEYEKSAEHIKSACEFSHKMEDPRAVGAVNFAAYWILNNNKKEYGNKFNKVLVKKIDDYRREAIDNLDKNRDHFELSYLQE